MVSLVFRTDTQGRNAYAPVQSPNKQAVVIAATGNATFRVPDLGEGDIIAAFCYPDGGAIWMSVNGIASAPASSTPVNTNSFANHAQLSVKSGDYINCYNASTDSQSVGVSYYVCA